MRKNYILIIFTLFYFRICAQSMAQESCTEKLNKAQRAFQAGQIEDIPSLINPCLNGGFDKEQKTQAYKLLTIANLYDKQTIAAEQNLTNLLRHDPLFKVDPATDPAEFIALYNSFRTHPVATVGLHLGFVMTYVDDQVNFGVENVPTSSREYETGSGLSFGIDVEMPLNDKFAFTGGLSIINRNINYRTTLEETDDTETNPVPNVNLDESQRWADLSLGALYAFRKEGWKPYVGMAVSGSYLISATGKLNTLRITQPDIEGADVDIKSQRNLYNWGLVGFGGLRYTVARNIIDFRISYYYNFMDNNKEGTRSNSLGQSLAVRYGYVDNDTRVNTVQIEVGYRYMLFNPKKVR